MKSPSAIIEKGRNVVRVESDAVAALAERIDERFARAVEMMYSCRGRIVVTGMGKSGIIARKIVATLNSTGTPSLFLHPSDAVHGDIGMVRKEDVVLCLSKSGDTAELQQLLPMFKRIGVPIIGMVGNANSRIAQLSDIILDVSVKEEACPYDLAPTSSTTVTLVLGDALAMALLNERNFTREEFALYHPGGNLGKKLLLKIEELMVQGDAVPKVRFNVSVRDAILEITSKRLGATCVVDDNGELIGIVTDGDLRRMLQKTTDVTHTTAEMMMTRHPKTITKEALAALALQEMEMHNITQLVVVDDRYHPVGMVHLHELVKAGLSSESL
ncbi:MAG TPA: KpsF/GutQ family sugar-phosphate isomerase [Bacteroidota bacterium]|nr:KpsF/GutQ family sugar-phosphate isomerase [Bacteroidota bacterium]